MLGVWLYLLKFGRTYQYVMYAPEGQKSLQTKYIILGT